MKRHTFILISILLTILSLTTLESKAQCDTIANICEKNFTDAYLSDGQEYRALLVDQQTAEFHLTLYGGSTYRFGACSGMDNGNLIFRLFDEERNEIFSNEE